MFNAKLHSLQHAAHVLIARASQPPPPHRPFDGPPPPPQFDNRLRPFGDMGNDKNKGDVHSEETILFLFLAFGILIVLILIFLLLGFQTYLSWRIAGELVGSDSESLAVDKDFWRWDRERKERKKALRALEKGRSVRASWGYGSGSRSSRTDEEMVMSGARGSSVMLDKMAVKEVKRPFWSVKRWI